MVSPAVFDRAFKKLEAAPVRSLMLRGPALCYSIYSKLTECRGLAPAVRWPGLILGIRGRLSNDDHKTGIWSNQKVNLCTAEVAVRNLSSGCTLGLALQIAITNGDLKMASSDADMNCQNRWPSY